MSDFSAVAALRVTRPLTRTQYKSGSSCTVTAAAESRQVVFVAALPLRLVFVIAQWNLTSLAVRVVRVLQHLQAPPHHWSAAATAPGLPAGARI